MARGLRIEYPGAIYLVTVSGVERRTLFRDDCDRRRFLANLDRTTLDCQLRLFLYCLMPNHVHLLAETPAANLSQFMHKLETGYTVYFNVRHQRVGHLMQGRYGARLVEGDDYLLKLSRYVHLNPVHVRKWQEAPLDERLAALRRYRWSSYRGYVGAAQPIGFLETAPLLSLLGTSPKDGRRAYARFVETGLARSDDEFKHVFRWARWGIGDAHFQERVGALYRNLGKRSRRPEDISFRRAHLHRSSEEVLRVVVRMLGVDPADLRRRRRGCRARAIAARMLWSHAGMNQRQIGRELNIGTGAAVCQQQRALETALAGDQELSQMVGRLHGQLKINS